MKNPLRNCSLALALITTIGLWPISGQTTSSAKGFGACVNVFPGGMVPNPASKTVVDLCKFAHHKAIFATRFDTTRKTPNWAIHKLNANDVHHFSKRKRPRFFQDINLDATYQALDTSYTHSGFSRGHIVPAYDMSWNGEAYKATFNLTNVVPQKQSFNAGPWLGMESAFRKLARRKDTTVWDISGVYGHVESTPVIGLFPHKPTVPKCFYKIFVSKVSDQPRFKVLAALFEWNDFGKRKTWQTSLTTLDQIKKRTGINFLAQLPVEAAIDAQYWGVSVPNKPADCRTNML